MNFLLCLQQTRPVFFFQLLLAQDQLHLTVVVVHFAVLRVDLGIQVQRNMVLHTLLGFTSECDVLRSDLQVCSGLGNIGSLDIHVEVVALGLSAGGALGPCD